MITTVYLIIKMLLWYCFFATFTILALQFVGHSTAETGQPGLVHNKYTGSSLEKQKCATWHYHDLNGQCRCYPQKVKHLPDEWVRCSNNTILLVYGNCMIYNESERSTYIAVSFIGATRMA